MLTICQKNYQNSDNYKKESLAKFHNSLKLLGGVFNKLRTAQGQTYNILGQSLLKMLNLELEKELKNVVHFKTDDFAKLVLSQVIQLLISTAQIINKKYLNSNFRSHSMEIC